MMTIPKLNVKNVLLVVLHVLMENLVTLVK